ncbi:MAG: zf-HC2 domain-containing protein [Armatimonadetes bacterium]|nr:zf-HC2 domain-containing protein [Armatimonadota bacterium]
MRCGAVHNMMVEFAADGVDPVREADFRAHLAACAPCRAEWAEIEEANALLASYDLPMPDDAFFQRMTHAVMAATESQPVRRPAFRLRWAGASALACLVLAVGFWRQTGGPQPDLVTPASPVATGLAQPELAAAPAAAPAKVAVAPAMPASAVAPVTTSAPASVAVARAARAPRVHRTPVEAPVRVAAAPMPDAPVVALKPAAPPAGPLTTSVADASLSLPSRVAPGLGGRSAVMAALAAAANDTEETAAGSMSSETLVLAMAPEVEDLGSSTLVVQPSEVPAAERKRSVRPAVSVVGAALAQPACELNQP